MTPSPVRAKERTFPTRRCPACAGGATIERLRLSARRFCALNSTYRADYPSLLGIDADMAFPLVECAACGFVFAMYLPPGDFLDLVYDAVIDQDVAKFQSESPERVAVQCHIASVVCREFANLNPPAQRFRLLDFGCGYGTLLRAIASSRIDAVGFETSESRLQLLRAQGLRVCATIDELCKEGPFDAITLVDVLEHVAEPKEVLGLCHSQLASTGVLVVVVPNFSRSRVSEVCKAVEQGRPFSREVNPWEHLNYYSATSLDRILRDCGFTPREPLGCVDVGVRPRLDGTHRIGNCMKSIVRALRYAFGWYAPDTLRVGHKTA